MFSRSASSENATIQRRFRNVAIAGGAAVSLFLLGGCAGGGEAEPAPEVSEGVSIGRNTSATEIDTEYFTNGTRRVLIDEGGNGSTDAIVVGYCEGGDLVEITSMYQAGGMERSVGHAACADNRLTPDDFPPLPQ